ncbi:MAG: DNA repair protein RadA [Hydrogenophilales bacterium CG03_land_8_20_14_0_80_62_28]|nr:MAG: DNA repair protein RadA [Hydrogenophilaceae bacterium CG1_02_62_390]PIV24212.1 MAG: DNA repair protein RadA [Hydrogenophilales bacterium CG03_land_8_20_14_0_80_62_28]PIW70947.1 MAG: DNA repair protein RadA [Hydrogenophilales bacterium CG12_big_fil_rev_8_21_14_0_65_61_21]PIY97492.1 MAG: DNA repair protein RadA [Hydrogenophilales bacterium CG_4_10_14_0_8_um_filter_62_70]
MAKDKTLYVCLECGGQTTKWQGQCPHCLAWNTLSETVAEAKPRRFQALAANGGVQRLSAVQARDIPRIATSLAEFDRVLGGGLVEGGVALIGGDPGIGKSTLLLQALAALSAQHKTLYVSGEESADQIAMRANRLGLTGCDIPILTEIRLESVLATLKHEQPRIAVIDSIQTLYTEALQAAPGSVSQVRECAQELTRYAKQTGTSVVFIGHVTKEGALAGPRVLEHIVDTVLYFEGDTGSSFRLIRAFKNRFGAVNELGVFAMTDRGLKGVNNPSALFLNRPEQDAPGSCVVVTQEGTRPMLVEIQALVDSSHTPTPRRLTVGLDPNRLAMLLAVLHRHGGIGCFDQDVFVNVVGGVRIVEPAADMAILTAVVSSIKNKVLPHKLAVFGEIGLAGEIRPVQRGQERLKEAAKLGFNLILLPKANMPKQMPPGVQVKGLSTLQEALECLRNL